MHNSLMENLVQLIGWNTGMADSLLAQHQCSPAGKCTCSTPNMCRPWPCTTYRAAEQARYLQELRSVRRRCGRRGGRGNGVCDTPDRPA